MPRLKSMKMIAAIVDAYIKAIGDSHIEAIDHAYIEASNNAYIKAINDAYIEAYNTPTTPSKNVLVPLDLSLGQVCPQPPIIFKCS